MRVRPHVEGFKQRWFQASRVFDRGLAGVTTRAPTTLHDVLKKSVPQPSNYHLNDVRFVNRHGGWWKLKPRDYFQWHVFFGFKDDVLDLLRHLASQSRNIIDVGANIGLYTVLMSKEMRFGGQLLAVEPFPSTFDHLRLHLRINAASYVVARQVALGATNGEMTVQLPAGEPGKVSLRPFDGESTGSARIEITTVDQLMTKQQIPTADLIKIDVEGFEPHVLIGAQHTLIRDEPILCFEYTPEWARHDIEACRRGFGMLAELGYQMYVLPQTNAPEHNFGSNIKQLVEAEGPDNCGWNVLAWTPRRANRIPEAIRASTGPS